MYIPRFKINSPRFKINSPFQVRSGFDGIRGMCIFTGNENAFRKRAETNQRNGQRVQRTKTLEPSTRGGVVVFTRTFSRSVSFSSSSLR